MRVRIGLIVAVAIGIIIALYPLYAYHLTSYIWTMPEARGAEGEGYAAGENTIEVSGIVESVNASTGYITVDGKEIRVIGTWTGPNGETLEASQLLEEIKPDSTITVYAVERGRWGLVAEKIVIPGEGEYVRG